MSYGLEPLIASLGERIVEAIAQRLEITLEGVRVSLSSSISAHIERTLDRCTTIRTIVSHDRDVALKDIYIPNTVRSGSTSVSENRLTERLARGEKIVVCGSAGQGKTVLTRYIALSMIEKPTGVIPLLVNLRDIDFVADLEEADKTRTRFYESVFHLLCSSQDLRRDHKDLFFAALEHGAFALILDGFDEIAPANRAKVNREIQNIPSFLKSTGCLVTSRFGTRVELISGFSSFSLSPLSKDQAMTLVDRAPYDDVEVKHFFALDIEDRLYDTHRTFLEVPLLVLVMLLSYKRYGPISDRISAFYSLAYSALFHEADAAKAGFKRERLAPLTLDQFRVVFEAFCAKSFFDSKYNFDYNELHTYLLNALNYVGLSEISCEDLIQDLIESVCLLQRDGLEYSFVHRSFQEYFCACFLTYYDQVGAYDKADEVMIGSADSVVRILWLEIDKGSVERKWVYPTLSNLYKMLDGVVDVESGVKVLKDMGKYGLGDKHKRGVKFRRGEGKFWDRISRIRSLYGDNALGNSLLLRKDRLYISAELDRDDRQGSRPVPDVVSVFADLKEDVAALRDKIGLRLGIGESYL